MTITRENTFEHELNGVAAGDGFDGSSYPPVNQSHSLRLLA